MNYNNLIISILIMFAAGYIYDKFKINTERDDKRQELNIIKKYLLNTDDDSVIDQLSAIKKPIIWIHIDYKKNARNWESFGSRNSYELNQNYLYLTIRSIINKCSDYFHVVLIDDDSFGKIIPEWKVDLNKIAEPLKNTMRTLGIMKILYDYGGITMENSFILFKSLKPIYEKILKTQKMCVSEFPNTSIDSYKMFYMPNTKFIGCIQNCPKMYEFINHLEILVSNDYTNELNLDDLINKWLYMQVQNDYINYIDGKFMGTKQNNNKMIQLEDLMSASYLDLDMKTYGLYIPRDELLKRTAYNWFVSLTTTEVLESNTNIGKYLLLSNN